MERPHLTSAEKEIALRGHIIEALVSENIVLKEKLNLLASAIAAKQAAYSLSELEMLENLTGLTISEKGNGITGSNPSISRAGNGITEPCGSVSRTDNACKNSNSSIYEIGKGITYFTSSISRAENASTNLHSAAPEKESGQTQALPPLPEKITEETLSLFLIRIKLKELTGYKGRKSALYSTAALFVHLYNGGEGGYPALQKAASLSEGGLAKLLMSLRKKGLIVNKGYRQPALTERAMHIIKAAWAVRQNSKPFPKAE